ncbi:MAG: oligosaccharide flippase family protein [Melioribacteraceae bacterium]|nr:oligosaccharide flippase family protein [Melioribacteraceae bacterium]
MLAQKLLVSYSSKIINQFIQLAVTVVVARVAGPTVIGTVAFALAYTNTFKFISDLGIGTAHIKLVSEGKHNEGALLATMVRIKFLLLIIFVVFVSIVFIIQYYFMNLNFESNEHVIVIFLSLSVTVIEQLYTIPKTTFAAKVQQARQDIPNMLYNLIFQILRLSVVLIGFGAIAIVSTKFIAAMIVLFIYYKLFSTKINLKLFDSQIARKYFSISGPIIIIMICQSVIYMSDKVILQFFTNSTEVGIYTAGFKFGGYIQMIGSSIGILFLPIFSKAFVEDKIDEINHKIKKFARFSFNFILPLALFIAIFSDQIILILLGAEYIGSIPILAIITFSTFLMVSATPYGNIISGRGEFKNLAYFYTIQLFVFLLLAITLVYPEFLNLKGLGLSMSILISNVILALCFLIFAKKIDSRLVVGHGLSSFVFGLVYSSIYYILYVLFGDALIYKIFFVVLFFPLYFILSYYLKITTEEDYVNFKLLFNIGKIKKYISVELRRDNDEKL